MNRELSFWQLYFIAHWPHTAALVDLWIHTRGWVYDKITPHSLCCLARARPVVYIAALPCWSAIESPSIAWVAVWKDSKDSRVAAGWLFFFQVRIRSTVAQNRSYRPYSHLNAERPSDILQHTCNQLLDIIVGNLPLSRRATPRHAKIFITLLQKHCITKVEHLLKLPDCNHIEHIWDEFRRVVSRIDCFLHTLFEFRQALFAEKMG